MIEAIEKLIGIIAGFQSLVEAGIAAYKERTAELQAQRISTFQKDMNSATTSDDIKKATDEAASALSHL